MADQNALSQYSPRMAPNQPGELNTKRTVLLSLSFTTVLLAWSYFNFKVPLLLDELIPENPLKDGIKGFIMAMDNLVAVLLQPYFGKLSDRTGSKLGRRMPFILIGTLSAAFFFAVLPWIRVFAGFVIIVLLFDIAMSFYRAVSVAIVPDYTRDDVRSKASAIQQFIANMGGVVGFAIPIIVGFLAGLSDDWERGIGFLIVAVVMVVFLIIQLVKIQETPTGTGFFKTYEKDINIDPTNFEVSFKNDQESTEKGAKSEEVHEEQHIYKEIVSLFREEEKSFAFMMLVVFFAYLAFSSIEAFFSSFAVNYLGKAESVSSTLFLAYSVPMILSAPLWGALGQKIGRKKASIYGMLGILVSMLIMAFVLIPLSYNPVDELETNVTMMNFLLMINLAFISMPWMCFIVNSFPIVWNLAPKGRVGTYTGIYYTFNQLAYTLGPVIMGLILSAFGSLGTYRYVVMFPAILAFEILSFVFMLKVKRGDVDISQEEMEEYKRKYEQID